MTVCIRKQSSGYGAAVTTRVKESHSLKIPPPDKYSIWSPAAWLRDSQGSCVGCDTFHQWGYCGAGAPVGAEWHSGGNHQPAAGQRCLSDSGHSGFGKTEAQPVAWGEPDHAEMLQKHANEMVHQATYDSGEKLNTTEDSFVSEPWC